MKANILHIGVSDMSSKRWWLALSHEAVHVSKGHYDDMPKVPAVETAEQARKKRPEMSAMKSMTYGFPVINESTVPLTEAMTAPIQERLREYEANGVPENQIVENTTPSPYFSNLLRHFLIELRNMRFAHRNAIAIECEDTWVVHHIKDIGFNGRQVTLVFEIEIHEALIEFLGKHAELVLGRYDMSEDNIITLKVTTTVVDVRGGEWMGDIKHSVSENIDFIISNVQRLMGPAHMERVFKIRKQDYRAIERLYFANVLFSPFIDSDLYYLNMRPHEGQLRSLHREHGSKETRAAEKAGGDMNKFNALMGRRK